MNTLKIAVVPAVMVEVIWPLVLPLIQLVVEKAPDEVDVDIMKQALIDGQEWMVTISDGPEIVAVNILKIHVFDTGVRTLYIPIIGGSRMDEWMKPFLDMAHAAARDMNCTELRGIACRKGWLRKLKDYDWYRVHEIVGCEVKPLTNKEVQ